MFRCLFRSRYPITGLHATVLMKQHIDTESSSYSKWATGQGIPHMEWKIFNVTLKFVPWNLLLASSFCYTSSSVFIRMFNNWNVSSAFPVSPQVHSVRSHFQSFNHLVLTDIAIMYAIFLDPCLFIPCISMYFAQRSILVWKFINKEIFIFISLKPFKNVTGLWHLHWSC
jgi:hypothetical protein